MPKVYGDYWAPKLTTLVGGGFINTTAESKPITTITIRYDLTQNISLMSDYWVAPFTSLHSATHLQELSLGSCLKLDFLRIVPWLSVHTSTRWQAKNISPTIGISLGTDYQLSEQWKLSIIGRYTLPHALITFFQVGYRFSLSDDFDPL